MKYKYTATTHAGDGRSANEDFIGVYEIERGILAIVCDGVGVKHGTNVAAKLVVPLIFKEFSSSSNPDYLERIKTALSSANQMLTKYAKENLAKETFVTTADVLFVHDKTAYWGHVGDSRIYNLRNGTLHMLTKDHSLVQQLVDKGFLTMKEAEHHHDKNVIFRALGKIKDVEIDLSKMQLNNLDKNIFLVCTDGVSKVINSNELERLIKKYDINKCTDQIKKLINSRHAPDDYSFALISSE